MKKIKQITALCLVLAVSFTALSVPSFATDYQSEYNFWNWAYDNSWFVGKLISGSADNVCAVSEDGLHHATQHSGGGLVDGKRVYTCVCDFCAQEFTATATDLENSYNDYYNNTPKKVYSDGRIVNFGRWEAKQHYTYDVTANITNIVDTGTGLDIYVTATRTYTTPLMVYLYYYYDLDFDCTVTVEKAMRFDFNDKVNEAIGFEVVNLDTNNKVTMTWDSANPWPQTYSAVGGVNYRYGTTSYVQTSTGEYTQYIVFHAPYIYASQESVSIDDTPVVSGGSFSYTQDENTTVGVNSFVDVEKNTFYNPATDTTYNVQSWDYDYATRTYTGYSENGNVSLMYGDEYISVVEGGNTYNYYYATPDSSGGNGGSGESGDIDGESIWDKLGHLLGELVGGLLDLITGVISGLLDNLIALVETTLEKLGSIVNLFGSFGDALKSLWSWLPEDIVTILAAGVSVVVFASVIKLFI